MVEVTIALYLAAVSQCLVEGSEIAISDTFQRTALYHIGNQPFTVVRLVFVGYTAIPAQGIILKDIMVCGPLVVD